MNSMPYPFRTEEELDAMRAARAPQPQVQVQVAPLKTEPEETVNLGRLGDGGAPPNPWGIDGSCLGLKILCGGLGLIIVILVVVLIVRMTHKGDSSQLAAQPAQSMSIQGGGFGNGMGNGFEMDSLM